MGDWQLSMFWGTVTIYTTKMHTGLVSIIIPAYNAARYLSEAVNSALHQTYSDVEIIVVDDGSTDNIKDIARPYREAGKIQYIYQENKGLSAARNTGIRAARGEYIAFLDSDDLFLPDKLEKQVRYLEEHPACDICYCNLKHFYEEEPDRMLQLQYRYYSGADAFPHLLWKNFINPLSVVLRRSVFDHYGYFNESMRRSEDWDMWVRAAYRGARFDFLPEALARYRMRRGSLSYAAESEIQRKQMTLAFFKRLRNSMPPADRMRYRMNAVIAYHWLKFLYAHCASVFFPLRMLQQWRQEQQLR